MLKNQRLIRIVLFFLLGLSFIIIISGLFFYYQKPRSSDTQKPSNYEIYSKSSFYQPSDYPINQTITSSLYQPLDVWTGRLILPPKEQRHKSEDVVFFEVYHADDKHQDLVGKIVELKWNQKSEVQEYIKAVTQDISFTQETQTSQKLGNLHPDRLNNWKKVGSLESLAGSRPQNDVMVMLKNPAVVDDEQGKRVSLIIEQEPVQVSGRFYGLVTIIQRQTKDSDRFMVRHYNKTSKKFDGASETIRIPQVPPDRDGISRSTNYQIEKSPLNPAGWYIYGAKGADGMFVVQALEPQTVMRLQPNEVVLGLKAGTTYINQQIWKNTEAQKGTAKTVLIDPKAKSENEAFAKWREGDTAIVIHTFGGIGGKKAEPTPLGLVTGHFAYGIADVVRDRLTDELRFDIEYRQIYAHNPDGITSGTIKWSSYMGDLWRGWLGNRPVSDIIVKLEAITQDYNFDGIKLSPITELTRQLDIMTARYRIGDGTGAAIVTPASSCVQDSNQALYVTIKRIEAEIQSNPRIQDWLKRHPNDAQTLRFQKLVTLGQALERNLVPLGMVRSDWRKNADKLAGIRTGSDLINTLPKAATTWRTVMPRRAQDEMTTILLKNGASLWSIRTNQVGGFNPDITPRAPTAILGHRTN